MIKFACPGCAASFTVADEKAGSRGKCPKCQTQFSIPAATEAAAPPPTKTADAPDEPVEIKPCPKCGERLSVMGSDLGLEIECPKCTTVFKAAKVGSTAAARQLEDDRPAKKPRDDEEDDDRANRGRKSAGGSKRRDEEDDDDRPSKKKASRRDEDDDEDDRPAKKKASKRDEEDDEEDEPKANRGRKPAGGSKRRGEEDDDEEEDDKPANRGRKPVGGSKRGRDDDDEEEDDDKPAKSKSKRLVDEEEDEEDDRPRRSKGGKGGPVESKRMLCALLALFAGTLGVHKFILGHTLPGIVYLFTFGLCGFGSLIDAIIYFTKTDKEFIKIYQKGGKQWF
jgi:predicted Zn finger-like uncharacterized protein